MHVRRSITIAVIAALSLAACGDDSDTASDTTSAPAAAPATSEESMADDSMEESMAEDSMEESMSEDSMEEPMADDGVLSIVAGRDDLTTLAAAVEAAGLSEALHGEGPFTIFAPTDAAFEAYLGEMGMTAEDVLADTAGLTALLQQHVVAGADDAAMVMSMADQSLTSLAGTPIAVTVDGDTVMVANATVVEYDLRAGNGVVHVIDAVIVPGA